MVLDASVSDKMAVLDRLIEKVDVLLLGGGMANTFLKAQGYKVSASLVEDECLNEARAILAKARYYEIKVVLPTDVVIAEHLAADAETYTVPVDQVPNGWRILDIGSHTIEAFRQVLADAHTILWNGTLGVAELPPFDRGTQAIITIMAAYTRPGVTTIIGGGDSAAAVTQAHATEKMSHVSTGGGASLEFLEGHALPGVAALLERTHHGLIHGMAH